MKQRSLVLIFLVGALLVGMCLPRCVSAQSIYDIKSYNLGTTGSTIKGSAAAGTPSGGASGDEYTNVTDGHLWKKIGSTWTDQTLSAITGDVTVNTSGVSAIGSSKVTSAMIVDGTIVNADINASAAIVDTKLTTIATAGKVSNSATTATSANTASAIVARGGSGEFSMGALTATTGVFSSDITSAANTGAPTFVSQTTGWRCTTGGNCDERNLFVDELHAKSFIADLEQALAGSQIIAKSVAIVNSAFTCPTGAGSTTTLLVDYLPGAPSMQVFQTNDYVVLRAFSRSGGSLTIADCIGLVDTPDTSNPAFQSWVFHVVAGGSMSGGTVVPAKSVVLDYGVSGGGVYEVTAADGAYDANGPYAQIKTWTSVPSSGNFTTRCRFGNENGITSVVEYGLLCGDFSGKKYIRLTDTNAEIAGIPLRLYDGSTETLRLDPTVPSFALGSTLPTAFGTGTGVWMGKSSGVYKFRVGDPSADRLAFDGTNLTLVSATVGIDTNGIHVAPNTSNTDDSHHGYVFPVASGSLGLFSYDFSGARGMNIEEEWTGGGTHQGIIQISAVNGSNVGFFSVEATNATAFAQLTTSGNLSLGGLTSNSFNGAPVHFSTDLYVDGGGIYDGNAYVTNAVQARSLGISVSPAYSVDIATVVANDRGVNILATGTGSTYGLVTEVTGAATLNTAIFAYAINGATNWAFYGAGGKMLQTDSVTFLNLAAPSGHSYHVCVGSTGLLTSQSAACAG